MAYDSLKALIRQYIKTNGEQEITGQILQNVLVEMVNQYPSTDGFATQSWVTSQGYATTSQLAGYLPLTGGTLTGGLNISDGSHGYAQLFVDEDGLNIMTGSLTGTQQLYTGRIYSDSTIEATGSITGFSFIKAGGTSSQFLKADGSLDSNTYITASALSGYATQSWVTSQLAGYATTSQLAGYLPLTGGTITGNLTVDATLTTSKGRLDVWTPQNYTNLPRCLFIIENVEWARLEMDTSAAFHFKHGSTDNTYSRIYAASFNQASDLRKKTIIGDVPINIYNVANAPLFKFTWNDETKYSGQHIGSAAQYWQTVLPELVSIGRDADMTLAMQYDVIALASAITVAKTVVNHEERIILLERENEALKKEIADLKSA